MLRVNPAIVTGVSKGKLQCSFFYLDRGGSRSLSGGGATDGHSDLLDVEADLK